MERTSRMIQLFVSNAFKSGMDHPQTIPIHCTTHHSTKTLARCSFISSLDSVEGPCWMTLLRQVLRLCEIRHYTGRAEEAPTHLHSSFVSHIHATDACMSLTCNYSSLASLLVQFKTKHHTKEWCWGGGELLAPQTSQFTTCMHTMHNFHTEKLIW